MTDGIGEEPLEAFDVLADETRAAILQALAEHQRDDPADRAMEFAELRRQVGMRDSGNFNYHLDRLRGRFVERTDDGYRLTVRGMRMVATLLAGAYEATGPMEPFELDRPCPVCGEPLTASYENGLLSVTCDDDHGLGNILSSDVVERRSPDELLAHLARRTRHDIEHLVDGECPMCYGDVGVRTMESDVEDVAAMFDATCGRCGVHYVISPAHVALVHPAVTWFTYDHGVDLREDPFTGLEFVIDSRAEQVATDPPRYDVVVEADGETLTVTVDGSASVVAVEEP